MLALGRTRDLTRQHEVKPHVETLFPDLTLLILILDISLAISLTSHRLLLLTHSLTVQSFDFCDTCALLHRHGASVC